MDEQQGAPKWLRRLLPFVVLGIGAAVTAALIKTRKAPERQAHTERGMLVEVLEVHPRDWRVRVVSQGTVQPRREVAISPQVTGKVIRIHPSLVVGGIIRSGSVMVKLDPTDYELALERARARLAEAEKSLAEADSNAEVARREWKVLGKTTGGSQEANPLTLYEPQLKLAQAGMRSAQAEVKQAEVNLSRTVIRAPFNLRVRSESVERGKYVTVGQQLATVYGTDEAEVIVPLAPKELPWLDLPHNDLASHPAASKRAAVAGKSTVTLRMRVDGQTYERPGRLDRTIGEVDSQGRMSRVVVRLEDPYNLHARAVSPAQKSNTQYRPDFEVGAFVDVVIEGRRLEHVIALPATALRLGNTVWTVGQHDRLLIRKVDVARLTQEHALIVKGLDDGDRVVLTSINGAVDGMRLRIKPSEAADAKLSAEAQPAPQ